MKKISPRQIFYIVTTISIVLITFLFSNQTSHDSKSLSSYFTINIFPYFKPYIEFIKDASETQLLLVLDNFVRKSAHMFIYFMFGISAYKVFSSFVKNHYFVIGFTILLSIIAASLDEFHQLFVKGRGAEIRDVFIDIIGVLMALTLIYVYKITKYFIIKKYKSP